jgi:hypothetical protein
MARTIQDAVDASGEAVRLDDLVNFGSLHRGTIDPTTGPRSYWFRFGDIRHLTLPQIHAAIGEIASSGQPGYAKVMRVSSLPLQSFTRWAPTSFFGLEEFTIDRPVVVKWSIDVS